ncbi:uncharacterized protein LOC127724693 isoform X6 [Mytilus californianus]|uniref:uncharacterized protein LOC127724693 isoform X6 n=1 Tax=Mytilus californianus TaxID=6549 RepID=UPI002246ABAE|nr:uncharacterized protein LOC127724693 isoform X6 [Mytilus californianus]
MTIASNHFQSVKMDIFKQNYINPGGFCNKKKIVVYVSLHLHLLICVLLVQQTNCSTCASPECLVGYDARTMPRPHTASGLCGRHCRYSWICDPCQILNSTAADEIDEMLFVVEPPKTICRNVREYRISLAIVNRMNLGNQTSQARTFARSLRKYEWNFETGSCGNNVVIFLSRYDRQIYTSAGEAAFKVLNEKCITGIYKKAKEEYFLSDDFEGGLKFMVQEYKSKQKPLNYKNVEM